MWPTNCNLAVQDMAAIQLALTDALKADALSALLRRSTQWEVECTDRPDPEQACVVVVDPGSWGWLPTPMRHPERVVLIARSEPGQLQQAWEAGVNSVVSEEDPLNTVVLAILSACLSKARVPEEGTPKRRQRP